MSAANATPTSPVSSALSTPPAASTASTSATPRPFRRSRSKRKLSARVAAGLSLGLIPAVASRHPHYLVGRHGEIAPSGGKSRNKRSAGRTRVYLPDPDRIVLDQDLGLIARPELQLLADCSPDRYLTSAVYLSALRHTPNI